jgi:hypothetical protein
MPPARLIALKRRHRVVSFVVGILIVVLIAVGTFILKHLVLALTSHSP